MLTLLTIVLMLGQTRKERENQELKNKIIEQSWQIIINEGVQSLSIRKIAEAIEYSVPVIYKHFENKEAILAHFSKEGYSFLSTHIQNSLLEGSVNSSKIITIARAYWEFASDNCHHYRIMFGLGIPACETINSSIEMRQTSNYMLSAITETLVQANNMGIDKHLKLNTFWSMLHGFVAIELLSNKKINKEFPYTVLDAVEGFIFTLENNKHKK